MDEEHRLDHLKRMNVKFRVIGRFKFYSYLFIFQILFIFETKKNPRQNWFSNVSLFIILSLTWFKHERNFYIIFI